MLGPKQNFLTLLKVKTSFSDKVGTPQTSVTSGNMARDSGWKGGQEGTPALRGCLILRLHNIV